MADQTNLPAIQMIPFKVGNQDLSISDKAQEVFLRRTAKGWDIQEIATMGQSSVFVRRDTTGSLVLIHKNVSLSEAKKEIVNMKGTYIITVPGYNKLNQIAGLHIITPPSIMVDGVGQANPAVIYSDKGEIKRVIARKIAIGYSPNGNLVAVDTVRHYNFDAYYLQDLHAKTGQPDAARYGTSVVCPFAPDAPIEEKGAMMYARKDNKVYVFKPIMDMEGIWIDPSHSEIKEVYKQHIQHQKFGDVTSQNMASRNAMKMHPAIAAAQVIVKNGEAIVPVFGYRHSITKDQFEEIGKMITAGEQPKDVQVVHDEGEASFEEVEVAGETEASDGTEAPTEGSFAPPEGDAPDPSLPGRLDKKGENSEISSLRDHCRVLAKEKKLGDLDSFAKNAIGKKLDDLNGEELSKLHGILNGLDKKVKK